MNFQSELSKMLQREEERKEKHSYSHWNKTKDRFYPVNATHDSLPSAIYETAYDNDSNVYGKTIEFPTDELLHMPGMPIDYILSQIKTFWEKADVFKSIGLVHKRGVLLYGPSGCGKTSVIRLLCNELIVRNGIVISVSDITRTQDFIQKLREIEPNRPLLTIFEDIETLVEDKDEVSDVLSFLDGEKQIGNIVHLATTNQPDILEDRLLRRPGRFDVVIGINPPTLEAREMYLKKLIKDKTTLETVKKMAEDTEGMGLAHLRELVVSILCLNLDYDETLRRLKGNIKDVIKMPKIGQKTSSFTVGFQKDES